MKNFGMYKVRRILDEIRQFCKLDEAGESLIRAAMGQMNLSACSI
jgi:hypothetical protein